MSQNVGRGRESGVVLRLKSEHCPLHSWICHIHATARSSVRKVLYVLLIHEAVWWSTNLHIAGFEEGLTLREGCRIDGTSGQRDLGIRHRFCRPGPQHCSLNDTCVSQRLASNSRLFALLRIQSSDLLVYVPALR